MDADSLRALLESVASGATPVDTAAGRLASLPFADVGVAKVDHHRELRCGFPEVVFCEGKTPGQVRSIVRELLDSSEVLLATRASAAHYQVVAQLAPDARYFEDARVIRVDRRAEPPRVGHIVVATGGTADSPVADEAVICAETMGNRVSRLYDVGVAGVHRLLAHTDLLAEANVVVAVAGMEGALPSVIAGLVTAPVIAVPTSIGYGASFGGVAALLAMLNSCACGVGVVNIDNGFGAAALASKVNHAAAGPRADAAGGSGAAGVGTAGAGTAPQEGSSE